MTHDPPTTMNAKSILQSKTFWLNVIALATAFFPVIKAWIAANPETAISALGALNILVRFVTSGRIVIFSAGETGAEDSAGMGSGMSPCWIAGLMAGGFLIGAALPSCTAPQLATFRSIPLKTCVITDYGTACYSSKAGISVTVDAQSGK